MSNKLCCFTFILAFLQVLGISQAQNCGFPSGPIRLDPVKENFEVGKVLEKIRVVHVADETKKLPCRQNGPEFIEIKTNSENKQMKITLLANPEPLIDGLKYEECVITTKIKCMDGRKKEITLIFPLEDMNSKVPTFVEPPHLFVELPWNCHIAVNFDKIIEIQDQDRDIQHALLDFRSAENSILEADAQLANRPDSTAHTFNLNLKLKPEYCTDFGMSLAGRSFSNSIHVFNQEIPELGSYMTVKISFVASERFESPPIFTSHVYQGSVNYNFWKEGQVLLTVLAEDSDQNSDVRYEMDADGHFAIDQSTGVVTLKTPPTEEYVQNLKHQVGIYGVQAFKQPPNKRIQSKYSTATLLVFYDIDDHTEPPGFECQSEGNFSDPDYCNIFHVCVPVGDSFQDNRMCCAYAGSDVYLVFCENDPEPKCHTKEHAEQLGCYCHSESYDSSCPGYSSTLEPSPETDLTYSPTQQEESTGTTELTSKQTEASESTTPRGPFKCWDEGDFKDPDYCNIFHSCLYTGSGYIGHRKCCPDAVGQHFLDYCEPRGQCLTRTEAEAFNCACSHDNHDRTCLVKE